MTNGPKIPLPGFLRFVWLFFMQPITLNRLLKSLGIDPDESGWKLLRKNRTAAEVWWLKRSTQTLGLSPLFAVVIAAACQTAGLHVDWYLVVVGVAFGVAGGVDRKSVV